MLLADEPVASLDPEAAEDVMLLLARLASHEGLGVVCVLHQPDLALRHAYRLVGLRGGRKVFDARRAEVGLATIGALYGAELPSRVAGMPQVCSG